MEEENKLVEERREKLKSLRAAGQAYPNDFRRKDSALETAVVQGQDAGRKYINIASRILAG